MSTSQRFSDADRADIYRDALAQILGIAAEMADQMADLYTRRAAGLRSDLDHLTSGGLPSPVRLMETETVGD